jgi:hypothetical protein
VSQFPIHDKVVNNVRHWIGVHEVPSHSNRGPVQINNPNGGVDHFQDYDFLNGHGYAWCVCTVQAAWANAGHPLPYKTAGAYDLLNWARRVGWARPSKDCVPGDILVVNEGSGHACILEKQLGDSVQSIDGNYNDQVMRVTRPRSRVASGIHVPEVIHKTLPPPPKPYWVITTSVNGHKQLVFSHYATQATIIKLMPALLKKFGKNGITIKKGGVRK